MSNSLSSPQASFLQMMQSPSVKDEVNSPFRPSFGGIGAQFQLDQSEKISNKKLQQYYSPKQDPTKVQSITSRKNLSANVSLKKLDKSNSSELMKGLQQKFSNFEPENLSRKSLFALENDDEPPFSLKKLGEAKPILRTIKEVTQEREQTIIQQPFAEKQKKKKEETKNQEQGKRRNQSRKLKRKISQVIDIQLDFKKKEIQNFQNLNENQLFWYDMDRMLIAKYYFPYFNAPEVIHRKQPNMFDHITSITRYQNTLQQIWDQKQELTI